jgi:hypothetical protein
VTEARFSDAALMVNQKLRAPILKLRRQPSVDHRLEHRKTSVAQMTVKVSEANRELEAGRSFSKGKEVREGFVNEQQCDDERERYG